MLLITFSVMGPESPVTGTAEYCNQPLPLIQEAKGAAATRGWRAQQGIRCATLALTYQSNRFGLKFASMGPRRKNARTNGS